MNFLPAPPEGDPGLRIGSQEGGTEEGGEGEASRPSAGKPHKPESELLLLPRIVLCLDKKITKK